MKTGRVVLGAALALLVALGGRLAAEFRHDLQGQRQRVAVGSRLLHTACGAIEVAESGPGDGPALLLVHGSGGGFDQALTLGSDHAARGYRVIAPSRFGYLRSPFPDDPSGERQSDHLACLLDALGLDDVAVMGVSAGAVSALHFAARHPRRTRALVLMVPAVCRPDPAVPMPDWALRGLDTVISADLPFWLLTRLAPGTARRLVLATPAEAYAAASAAERRRADTILAQILPVSARRQGLLNDSRLTTGAARAALESIRAPTLCISARDDGFGTYESARYSAEHIAGARFLGFDQGGHLLLGHQAEVVEAVDALLRSAPGVGVAR
jgi:2-hydroxy-6-oxonona-2,4-dienedioate hydrolase